MNTSSFIIRGSLKRGKVTNFTLSSGLNDEVLSWEEALEGADLK